MWKISLLFLVVLLSGALLVGRYLFKVTEKRAQPLSSASSQIESAGSQLKSVGDDVITLFFVGDIMLSRDVGKKMAEKKDWAWPFRHIADLTREADLLIGNLEGPISNKGRKVGSVYPFRADPQVIEGLTFAGFGVLAIANNHIWDYGKEAALDTLELLNKEGIDTVGVGRNYIEAHQGVFRDVRGTKVVILAYTDLISSTLAATTSQPAIALLSHKFLAEDITEAKKRADLVVVSFHTGEEYQKIPTARQKDLARRAIDAGANIVVGHHPHVVQEVERYKGGIIAYSLGNFIFDQTFSEETMQGVILRVVLKGGQIVKTEALPTQITEDYQVLLR